MILLVDPFDSDESSSSIHAPLNQELSETESLDPLTNEPQDESISYSENDDLSNNDTDEEFSDEQSDLSEDDFDDEMDLPSKQNGIHKKDLNERLSIANGSAKPGTSSGQQNTEDIEGDSDNESTSSEEVEASMQDIFGIDPNKEAQKNHPPTVNTTSPILDICFHPEKEILAAGNICGECILYRYSLEEVEEITKFTPHESSCRQICFNSNGSVIYTVSNDKSLALVDVEKSSIKSHYKEAHDAPIYSFYDLSENIVATGDDDGVVKLWDIRRKDATMEYKCSEETVTSLVSCSNSKFLSATCADGSLTGINIKKKKFEAQSEMFDSEFTCQSLVRSESRLAVGSGAGIFYIFNWGEFGYNIDALSGHPDQIQCQVAITDKIVVTGCNDGIIRATHLYPHRFLGVVGQHKDFSVDNLAVSFDGFTLASCSNDDIIQFWNIEYLYKKKVNMKKKSCKKMAVNKHLQSSRVQNKKDFFKDLPRKLDSDDDECGPIPGHSYDSD